MSNSQDQLISLVDATRLSLLRRKRRPLCVTTIWRWITRGCVRRSDGQRVYLRAAKLGGHGPMLTSESWVRAFIVELGARPDAEPSRPARESASADAALGVRHSRERVQVEEDEPVLAR